MPCSKSMSSAGHKLRRGANPSSEALNKLLDEDASTRCYCSEDEADLIGDKLGTSLVQP